VPQRNRWHAFRLPDNNTRKLKQDQAGGAVIGAGPGLAGALAGLAAGFCIVA